jgi:O-antigen/teichoic acid export membrane protein
MGLKKAIGWTMLSNIISAACQWSYIVVLTKFSTAVNVGYYAFALAIV